MPSTQGREEDAYARMIRKLGYPASRTLRTLFEVACGQEEVQLVLELPAAAEQLAERVKRDGKEVEDQLQRLARLGMVRDFPGPDVKLSYLSIDQIEPLSDSMMQVIGATDYDPHTRTIGDDKNRRIADLWNQFFDEEWYRFARTDELIHRRVEMLGGPAVGKTFTVTPAWKALEKCNAEPLPDHSYDLRHVARQAKVHGKRIVTLACSCKVRARKSSAPIFTCGSFVEGTSPAFDYDPRGIKKRWDPEEWLEMMGICEEQFALVHVGLPPNLYDVCTCDTECCNIFTPLKRHAHCYEGVEKSPYRSVVNEDACRGCPDCMARCRFEAISIRKDSASERRLAWVNHERCTGCGQCVLGCKVEGALGLELAKGG